LRENKRKITSLVILLVLLTSAVIGLSGFTQNANGPLGEGSIIASDAPYSETVRNLSTPFFTLTAMTNEGEEDALYARQKALYSLEHDLKQIGIGLDIQLLDWPTFVGQLIAFREFDMCYVGLSGSSKDPDYSGVYDENGSLNLFGYHTSMDYDEFLGTGINEWYIQHGLEIIPPDSQERITHYHEWQNYMMEEILPLVPAYTAQEYMAHWSNLQGFDYTSGLLQSWGKIYWSDIHPGQIATNELVIPAQDDWYDLNPLFSGDNLDELIEYGIMDPLVWYDKETSAFWPHIVSWEQLSDDQIRLHIRENIPWQLDPEGLFPGEYLDVEDVYFSLYCWKNISGNSYLYDWIADMQIVDQYTLDIIIDPNFIPHNTYLSDLNVAVLPEHYLNQTQDMDGITPDITHMSWNYFATQPFGTGI
jgi:ABC-type transport system substrate-binding protein